MALKKKNCKSKKELLYVLEVFVDRMNLCHDKIVINFDSVVVCVKFIDLATIEISLPKNNERLKDKENCDPRQCVFDFKSGSSCFFSKTPNSFVDAMKLMPLSIEVYSEESTFEPNKKRTVLCSTKTSIPTCMFEQVLDAKNQVDSLSVLCTTRNTYDLVDANENALGSISLILRLSCFGSSLVKRFSLRGKSFTVPDLSFGEDFRLLDRVKENMYSRCQPRSEDPSMKSLKRPESPPRIKLDEPGFENLTTAEKLNDPKYRDQIYRAYPNEPTCHCLPANRSSHPLECRSGCNRPCCTSLRDPKLLSTRNAKSARDAALARTYCVNNSGPKHRKVKAGTSCVKVARLRGGSDVQQIYVGPAERTWIDYEADCSWYGDKPNPESRLEGGGGGHEKSSCSCSVATAPIKFRGTISQENFPSSTAQDACKPQSRSPEKTKPGCACQGKDLSSSRTGNAKCTKAPCPGVDCLIRAFKEAQEFVDSLGKVPGLAGLGLMDPSESPYFGRDLDKDYAPHEPQLDKRKGQLATSTSPQCAAPCSLQPGKPTLGIDTAPLPYTSPAPLPLGIPGRTGIVREAVPTLPESTTVIAKPKKKEDKKEEKIEKQKDLDTAPSLPMDLDGGPCGEPKCKARRKKPVDIATVSHDVVEPPQWKSNVYAKAPSTPTPKTSSKGSERGRSQRLKPSILGASGDRNVVGRTPIRVSKRVMRYVYSIGDAYPGINYGHKNCIDPRMRVPANMGWLWNTTATAGKLKPRIGWKPGAIGRYLNEMLKEAKAGSLQEANRPRSVPSRTRKGKVYRSMSFSSVKKLQTKKEGEEEVEAPPTLHIHRKDGTYYVTMYPIKQETSDEPKLSEPLKPLQFKIVKNKDDASVASSSTASDMEIEFSPPAAINRYRRKPDVIHVDTQVRQQEIVDAFKPPDSLKKKEKKVKKEKKAKK